MSYLIAKDYVHYCKGQMKGFYPSRLYKSKHKNKDNKIKVKNKFKYAEP